MRLVILYGPPASGKLTIAKALAARTKFPLLHNHLVADFAHALFAFGTDAYAELAKRARSMAIDAALKANLPGLVMTFAYGVETKDGAQDDAVMKSIKTRVERAGGTVTFVRLSCDEAALAKRVGRSDRKTFGKVTNPAILKRVLKIPRATQAVPFADSLEIDTARLAPAAAAKRIVQELTRGYGRNGMEE